MTFLRNAFTADERERYERYAGRAPIALDRLSWDTDGTLIYRTKSTGRRGEPRVLVLTPLEILRKLAPIIPPPRSHAIRYSGVFGPSANGRVRALAARRSRMEPMAALELPNFCT